MAEGARALEDVPLRPRRALRRAGAARCGDGGTPGHMGHHARHGRGRLGPDPRPHAACHRARARGGGAGARVHGTRPRHPPSGNSGRPRVSGIVHERAHRGPARGGGDRAGPARRRARARDGSARIAARESAGRTGRTRSRVHGGGVRVAQCRLLDVPRHECRRAGSRGTVRRDVQPQLRGTAGARRPHASHEPRHGGGGRDRRASRGCARMVTVFVRHRGRAVTLPRRDVDTDQIIPKQFLKGVERTGYGPALFYDWRYRPDGSPNPDFELNRPAAEGATILITGPNFGCGSSREHAVWALTQYGFRAIIAPSFADIFTANCYRNGLLPVRLAASEVDALIQNAAGPQEIVVDLERQLISDTRGFSASFTAEAYGRDLLLRGVDEIGRTLLEEPSIAAFERNHA